MRKTLLIFGILIFAALTWAGTGLALRGAAQRPDSKTAEQKTPHIAAAVASSSSAGDLTQTPEATPQATATPTATKDPVPDTPTPAATPVALAPTPQSTPAAVAFDVAQPLQRIVQNVANIGQGLNLVNVLSPTSLYQNHGLDPNTTHKAYAVAGLLALLGLSAVSYGRKK